MRWYWIDRFLKFEQGDTATAVKCVALNEEQLDYYSPGYPYMPQSLMIEGMAQTGGLLVGETSGFEQRVVLAKVGKAKFERLVLPGDTVTYTCTINNLQENGAVVKSVAKVGDELVVDTELIFAYLDDERFADVVLFPPLELLTMIRLLHMYDVGKKKDGSPLDIPKWMKDAEDAADAADLA